MKTVRLIAMAVLLAAFSASCATGTGEVTSQNPDWWKKTQAGGGGK